MVPILLYMSKYHVWHERQQVLSWTEVIFQHHKLQTLCMKEKSLAKLK